MRTEKEILSLILSVAEKNESIRAIVLNGSRVNPNVIADRYQDYDIVFLVEDLQYFRKNTDWIDVFGERIIMQMPNDMQLGDDAPSHNKEQITYLMLFEDTNRIDLNLRLIDHKNSYKDSLSKVLLDKDGHYPTPITPSDKDYWIKRPTLQQFSDCCNEFWWVSTYVIKGLLRQELLYAKDMLEQPVRKMFLRMLSWHIGVKTNFSVNLGSSYKYLKKYTDADLWDRIIKTYPDAREKNIRSGFKEMIAVFGEQEVYVAKALGFHYNREQATKVQAYLVGRGL